MVSEDMRPTLAVADLAFLTLRKKEGGREKGSRGERKKFVWMEISVA